LGGTQGAKTGKGDKAMIEEFISDPKVIAAATVLGGVALDIITGAVKNSTMARKSWVLKVLAKVGLKFAKELNDR
jgi:hypothetical protein